MTHELLEIRGLSKAFPGVQALDGVDFTVRAGDIHALLGENGAGKSTLIKTLTGIYGKDGGTIHLDGAAVQPLSSGHAQRLGIGTVYQEVNLLPNLSVAENIYLGREPRALGLIAHRKMARDARALLARYNLTIQVDRPLGDYSIAIQQIVAIARAVDFSGRVLILDEPTASLDKTEVKTLFAVLRRLKAEGIGIVFVTHFLDQVFEIADRATVLRNGRLVGERRIADVSTLDIVTMMLGREMSDDVFRRKPKLARPDAAAFASFTGYGKRAFVEPFDLSVRPGEVIGLAGLLGSGRSETVKLIFGAAVADQGEARFDGRTARLASPRDSIALGIGYCPEDRKNDGIVGDLSIRENIIIALQAKRGWLSPLPRAEQQAIADHFIKALDIRTTDAEKPIRLLSGGNQQKALLSRWLATQPRLLLLDEPTRGIDVGAHAEIIRLIEKLCADGMALIVVSSELDELVVYADRIIVLRDRRHGQTLEDGAITSDAIVAAIAERHRVEDIA